MNRILALALIALFSFSPFASAKNCKKGKPCGNTCISKNDVCHVGEPAAAPAAMPTAAEPSAAPDAKTAKQCKKGKPCGNTCIPQKAVCHS